MGSIILTLRVTGISNCFLSLPLLPPRVQSATVPFNEESGITYDDGCDEVDSCAGESSLLRLASKDIEKRVSGDTWGRVDDNKQAEEEEAERQNGEVTKRKDSSGGRVSRVLPTPPQTHLY